MKRILILIFLFAMVPYSYTQISFSAGPSLGYSSPASDYSGSAADFYSGSKYGLKGGVNFGAVARVNVLILSGRVTFHYASFSNSGEVNGGNVENKQSVSLIGIGPEIFMGLPIIPVRPYVGIDFLISNFSGESIFTNVPGIDNGTYEMALATRTGLGFGAGVNIGLGKKNSVDFNVRYNLHNLFGRSFSGNESRSSSYTSLNDEADPLNSSDPADHPVAENRSVQTVQFNLAFLFDF